ncbi:MGMT family protein [Paeniglutamicibacter psychrophenolicus]|uniref:MGMT family protein n=1 Tax=Paeniglutamicibacter psychrophenolicus TaxID=257454 RepID=UPI00277D6AC6|nr:MGMT family protein [Paeniglutamicibacter psychrophenolicus]MDQ0095465.1 alkylated DNA nucleotide flippase Atl1 [Paeniglutamicibacter psychrophenolicus]
MDQSARTPVPETGGALDPPGATGAAAEAGLEYDEAVFAVVAMIPTGKVLSYGDIAELLGSGGPRQVGKVMGRGGSEVTWWRVIRSDGTLPAALQPVAAGHWVREATPRTEARVRMSLARWVPTEADHARIGRVAEALPVTKRRPRMI